MDQREVTTVASGMEGGGGLSDVLAHDGVVADLAVAQSQLVVGETDGARVVGDLRLLERPSVERNRARLLAAGIGNAPV